MDLLAHLALVSAQPEYERELAAAFEIMAARILLSAVAFVEDLAQIHKLAPVEAVVAAEATKITNLFFSQKLHIKTKI